MLFNPKPSKNPVNFKFPLQCVWLKLNGSWPLKRTGSNTFEKCFRFLYSVWAWYVVVMVGITIGFQSAFIVSSFGKIIVTTENCCTTFTGVMNLLRLLHFRLQQAEFQQLIEQFVKDIWISKSSHPAVVRTCKRNMRVFEIISALLFCLIMMFCFMPLFELYMLTVNEPSGLVTANKPFPYKMLFPYEANHGWRYALTYLFTGWAGVCVSTTLFAGDSLFGFFITYTCGQFSILHNEIDNIISNSYAATQERHGGTVEHFRRECDRRLDKIAAKHSILFDFIDRLEKFFSPIMLENFLISTLLICMVSFLLATALFVFVVFCFNAVSVQNVTTRRPWCNDNKVLSDKNMFIGDYIKFLVSLFSALSQLYVLCWNGDNLIQNSLEMANHLYACNWESDFAFADTSNNAYPNSQLRKSLRLVHYSTDSVFRRKLQFMILRSQRQTCITAMKFSILSLNSFSGLLSRSMSYFALLQSFYENEEK